MRNKNTALLLCFCFMVLFFHTAEAQTVEYELIYNESQCVYEAHAHVVGGERTYPNTIPFPSVFSIAISSAVEDDAIVVTEQFNPPGLIWDVSNAVYSPEADTDHDFYSFSIPGGAAGNAYAKFNANTDIHLFNFEVPHTVCDQPARMFIQGSDPGPGEAGMLEINFGHAFKLFPNTEIYGGNYSTNEVGPELKMPTPDTDCSGTEITLRANPGASCSGLSYQWTGPNGFSSTDENPVFPVTAAPATQMGSYTVVVTNQLGCSTSNSIELSEVNCLTALSVKLLTFTGNAEDDHNYLYWETASEKNNRYFEVERSQDGISFEAFHKIETDPANTFGNKYNTKDNNPFVLTYYRLKQVDADGAYTYSQVIQITRSLKDLTVLELFPNPVNDKVNVRYDVLNPAVSQFVIKNVAGKVMHAATFENEAGIRTQSFDTTEFPQGIYFISISNDSGELVKRFIVAH